MPQYDGNISFLSDLSDDSHVAGQTIPVHTGFRPQKQFQSRLRPVRATIKRNNKILQAVSLPKMSSYNMRSLMPKIQNFGTDMLERNCSLSFLSEIWEVSENKRHQFKIEELLEMKGLHYISTPRPGQKRGGGAALVVNTEDFILSKLNIFIPHNLEVVWGLLRPKEITGKITKIILCSFYCPPRSTRKSALIEHMTITLQSLRTTFPKAGVIVSGDRNDLSIAKLQGIDPALSQTVLKGTRGQNILTVILTDLHLFYEEPQIVSPIDVDDPTKPGVPSDHNGVVMSPCTVISIPVRRQKYVRTVRPITTSAINNIGQVLVEEEWKFMDPDLNPTELTELFEFYTTGILDIFCPQKKIFSRPGQKPFITEDMKMLKRKILREYEKRGKSSRYFELKRTFKEKYNKEVSKYRNKIFEEIQTGNRNSVYAALRKLGARPGEQQTNTFTLQSHQDRGLSSRESAEIIADYFATISQEYEPINIDNFSPNIKHFLSQPNMADVPILEEYQVYKKLRKAKKPNSSVTCQREWCRNLAVNYQPRSQLFSIQF